jgi:hypothetical protein
MNMLALTDEFVDALQKRLFADNWCGGATVRPIGEGQSPAKSGT